MPPVISVRNLVKTYTVGEVVVNMVTGLEPTRPAGQQGTGNPLMGPQRGGPGGGGNRGGGGGRGF